jgi:uncharacterized protein YqeY
MSIKDMLNQDMKTALKQREKERLSVIRMAKSAILYEEKDRLHELDDDEVIEVLSREVKKRKDSMAEYKKLQKNDVVEELRQEISILMKYLPEQMSEDEVEEIVRETISEVGAVSMKDMGTVMSKVMPKVKGRADGRLVSSITKKLLQ